VAATTAGEMAVILPNGALARLSLDGGVPREIAEHVDAADWAPDGTLAVLRHLDRPRIEFPLGRVFYEAGTLASIENLRVSPRGDRVAFVERPSGQTEGSAAPGSVVVIDRQGRRLVSTEWATIGGLAWSPDGREVWFTATQTGFSSAIQAFALAGGERLVARMGETVYLHDIFRDGRVLLGQGRVSIETRGRMAPDTPERDYSWLDGTNWAHFSADGRFFVFNEALDGGGPRNGAYLRRTDGSPPVRLGDGTPVEISPDGKWVVCISHGFPSVLRLEPTSGGEVRTVRRGTISKYRGALFLPDSQRLIVLGSEAGRPTRLFLQELPDGEPRSLTPEGVAEASATSPDGRFVTALAAGADRFALYPVDGGAPRPIPGIGVGEWPLRFSPDGGSLLVWLRHDERVRVMRLDLATGRRSPWLDFAIADPTGVFCANSVDVTPDGRSYLYSYWRYLSDLYVVEGLR
jgi:dipeptidyl aminopeptidase/acylaminoacyl peptidase